MQVEWTAITDMKALLVRIGVDKSYGGWNSPVDAEGRFVYVPIPESRGTAFTQGLSAVTAKFSRPWSIFAATTIATYSLT